MDPFSVFVRIVYITVSFSASSGEKILWCPIVSVFGVLFVLGGLADLAVIGVLFKNPARGFPGPSR